MGLTHEEETDVAVQEGKLNGIDVHVQIAEGVGQPRAFAHGDKEAAAHAEKCGIILADTKFEFGDFNGEVILIDEVLTPDSSRFWPKSDYRFGCSPPSLDKQFVRDYLESLDWDKTPPAPALPDEIVMKTREKYVEALKALSGKTLA